MAISIKPSTYWRGNDGTWSTFNVHIGTSAQLVEVLPATSQSLIWAVLQQGCPPIYPSDCATSRGGIFDPDSSKDVSWDPQQASDGRPYFVLPFQSESTLPNYSANGLVGFDAVTLDWVGDNTPDQPLTSQLIAGYAAANPWLGMLGLSNYSSHTFNTSSSEASLLENLRAAKAIDSSYWGYTAGARYKAPPAFGSLTLGGYDNARTDMSGALTVDFGTDSSRDLLVFIESISTLTSAGSTNVGGVQVYAYIDSVVPEIWLPAAACSSFEKAFGLVWDDTYDMYFVNDTQHQSLVSENPSVNFDLSGSSSSGNKTTITMPYAAFDLEVSAPLAGIQSNGTPRKYFPLKRAASPDQYYLGRVFLQEAYVTADYDRRQFTVSQAIAPSDQSASDVVPVSPPGDHSGGLSVGAIAGIAVGGAAMLAIAAGLAFWFWRRRRRQALQPKGPYANSLRTGSIGNTTVVDEMEQREYFKPSPMLDREYFKPELDAGANSVGMAHFAREPSRHELDAGSVRPNAHRHGPSWDSAASGVSSLDDNRIRSMMGEPSPPIGPGGSSPPSSPGGRNVRHHSAGSPQGLFEIG